MHKTLYDYKILKYLAYFIGAIMLKLFRWEAVGKMPDIKKSVIIAAPHTSNWDFFFTIMITFKLKAGIYWMGKNELFIGWRGPIMRFLGGVPVVRSERTNTVDQMVTVFNGSEHMTLVVPPEGTRSQVTYWKTGFYHIAHKAKVPIVLGFLDFKARRGGIGPTFHPTGDIDADMRQIKGFYKEICGKISNNYNKEHIPKSVSPDPIPKNKMDEIDKTHSTNLDSDNMENKNKKAV